jgi:hypothetical protein
LVENVLATRFFANWFLLRKGYFKIPLPWWERIKVRGKTFQDEEPPGLWLGGSSLFFVEVGKRHK